MKLGEKNVMLMLFATLAIVIAIGSACHIKAVARECYFTESTDVAETAYRQEVKAVLKSVGMGNAGITMTKISEDGHSIDYKVLINLPKYIDFNEERESNLMRSLNEVELNVEGASVSFSFS